MALRTQEQIEFIGLLIARSASLASPLVMFLALPPFYSGFWVQVEGAMPWLHWVSAAAALGCALALLGGSALAAQATSHALVAIPAALAALSFILLPFATIGALSILGAPEHGFGALAFLDLAALTAAAILTISSAAWRRAVIVVACITVAAAFGLDFLFRADRGWAPFFFGDYLAFYALDVFAIAIVAGRARPAIVLSSAALLLGLVLLSANRAGLLAIVAAAAAVVLIPRRLSPRSLAVVAGVFPVVAGLAIVLVGPSWREPFRETLLASVGVEELARGIADSWASLWSRAMLVIVGAHALIDSPWRLFTGFGWGHYNEALLANLPIVEGRFHELIGTSRVYWDAIRRADFHSHNQYFEALLSLGAGGAILTLAYGAWIVGAAPAKHRRLALFIVLALGVLQSFWFQMPHTLPVMAIAVAMLTARDEGEKPAPGAPAGLVRETSGRAILPVVAWLTLAAGGAAALAASHNAGAALALVRGGQGLGPDGMGFGTGLGEIYDAALLQAAYANLGTGRSSPEDLRPLKQALDEATQNGPPKSLKLAVSVVNVVSGLVFTRPEYEARFGSLDGLFGRGVERLIALAPRRSDLAIPYFNYLLAHGREAKALGLAERILSFNPEDAAGLWFSGIVLLGKADTAARGMDNLKRSLRHGIREQMPVSPELLQAIEQSP